MAGLGSRFSTAGYENPKPLISIYGKPMIEHAVNSLGVTGNYVFITQKEHSLKSHLEDIYPGCKVIEIDYITEGSACTCLLAKEYINNDYPLLITNCDQIMWWDDNSFSTFLYNIFFFNNNSFHVSGSLFLKFNSLLFMQLLTLNILIINYL